MPPRPSSSKTNIITIGETSGRLIAPDEVMAHVTNLRQTEEGGFISEAEPIALLPGYASYGKTKGLFHCTLDGGQRDILLLHNGQTIWEFRGWERDWHPLVGAETDNPNVNARLAPDDLMGFPTQFVSTTNGVVIIPQGSRAYFYDGTAIAQLGYAHAPAPPTGLGPDCSDTVYTGINPVCGVNDVEYAMDGLPGRISEMSTIFRRGRIGTIQTHGAISVSNPENKEQAMGYLLNGIFRARVQWVDRWGNLSPLSPPSNDVKFSRQPATGCNAGVSAYWVLADLAQKQIAWDGIASGPNGTIGRIIYRTRDTVNTGDVGYWELPLNASTCLNSFATLPDNVSNMYPDNIPDSWLGAAAVEVDPVPIFKVAWMAMGRLWVANAPGEEGMMRPSFVGKWGTFAKGDKYWPDPTGAAITGGAAVGSGCLVFTERSTFLVTPNDSGDGYKMSSLHSTSGCVAPSSIQQMRNGVVVWLGHDGFYAYDGNTVSYAFEAHRDAAKRWVSSRLRGAVSMVESRTGRYRCWLPSDGGTRNTYCWSFDGVTWDESDAFSATGACETRNSQRLPLVSGVVDGESGVWVLNRGTGSYTANVQTGWIRSSGSDTRASIRHGKLWLRETGYSPSDTSKVQVYILRDWRAGAEETYSVERYPEIADAELAAGRPSFFDNNETWDTAVWRKRSPFWSAVHFNIPSCEVFKVVVSCPARFEILGFSFEQDLRDDGTTRNWRS